LTGLARAGNVPSVRPWEALVPARLDTSFRWLLGSSWATNISDGIALAAGPLLIAGQTNDPFLVALAALLLWLPWLIFALFAGALADRVDRRVLLATANVARAVVLAALVTFVATGRVDVVVVLVTMFLLGTAETFADTTSQTMLPTLVAKPDLGTGNARIGASMIVGNQLLGPPIGAALFAAGTAWPFVTQAVLLTLGALLVTRIVLPAPAAPAPDATRRVHTEIADGVRWLWSHPPVRALALTIVGRAGAATAAAVGSARCVCCGIVPGPVVSECTRCRVPVPVPAVVMFPGSGRAAGVRVGAGGVAAGRSRWVGRTRGSRPPRSGRSTRRCGSPGGGSNTTSPGSIGLPSGASVPRAEALPCARGHRPGDLTRSEC